MTAHGKEYTRWGGRGVYADMCLHIHTQFSECNRFWVVFVVFIVMVVWLCPPLHDQDVMGQVVALVQNIPAPLLVFPPTQAPQCLRQGISVTVRVCVSILPKGHYRPYRRGLGGVGVSGSMSQ